MGAKGDTETREEGRACELAEGRTLTAAPAGALDPPNTTVVGNCEVPLIVAEVLVFVARPTACAPKASPRWTPASYTTYTRMATNAAEQTMIVDARLAHGSIRG